MYLLTDSFITYLYCKKWSKLVSKEIHISDSCILVTSDLKHEDNVVSVLYLFVCVCLCDFDSVEYKLVSCIKL